MSVAPPRSFVEEARRAKLTALAELGVAPYAYAYRRTHTASEALATYADAMGEEGPEVSVAGRLVSFRGQGKTSFGHLEDVTGRLQVYFRADQLGERYELVKLLDLGDYVGVRGPLFRTKAGEVTVRVQQVELLAKSLRPLPLGKSPAGEEGEVSYGGLADPETRYRQRYADLAVHPGIRETFRLRAQAIRWLRRFLDDRGFLEVETPILQPLYGGAAARPFVTHHHTLDTTLYLRIADELYLKRLVVGNLERVYEIGHDFRNEGMDRTHNPEFTMLECYQAYADYRDILELTETMISGLIRECCGSFNVTREGTVLDFTPPWPRRFFLECIETTAKLDLRRASEPELRKALERRGVAAEEAAALSGGRLQDAVFKAYVEPTLIQPTFVLDYPRLLSPLAKAHREDPWLAERFELFVQGREIANAFSELNDPEEQRQRFEEQARERAKGDDEAQQLDADYLRALEYGMPPTGGLGVGFDRLMMIIANQPSIRDVILFPAMRPEAG